MVFLILLMDSKLPVTCAVPRLGLPLRVYPKGSHSRWTLCRSYFETGKLFVLRGMNRKWSHQIHVNTVVVYLLCNSTRGCHNTSTSTPSSCTFTTSHDAFRFTPTNQSRPRPGSGVGIRVRVRVVRGSVRIHNSMHVCTYVPMIPPTYPVHIRI